MRAYLRIANPVVSVVVLLLCLYAATVDEGDFEIDRMLEGGFSMYFIAKGLFCSSALFILGHVLLSLRKDSEAGKAER